MNPTMSSPLAEPLPYQHSTISLLTQHGKERVMAPLLRERCGATLVHTRGYDTDQLGTFTRDIPRWGTQLEAARKKARIGMALTGLHVGLASEGAFGPDPYTGLLTWNVELVLLIDDQRGLELQGVCAGPAPCQRAEVADWDEVVRLTQQAAWAGYRWVLRPDTSDPRDVCKGLASLEALKDAFEWAQRRSTGKVLIENDLRADAHPARMEHIRQAAQDLAQQMNSLCPQCGSPGYAARAVKNGLPCRLCGSATDQPMAKVWTCLKCAHQTEHAVDDAWADPSRCGLCNP